MNFLNIISGWMNRYLSQEDAVYLVVALSLIVVLLYILGGALAPVLTGLVIAFFVRRPSDPIAKYAYAANFGGEYLRFSICQFSDGHCFSHRATALAANAEFGPFGAHIDHAPARGVA